jgi:hypothetical protein
MNRLTTLAAGATLALALSPATAELLILQDDNIDFHLDSDLNPRERATSIDLGDVLLGVLDFTTASQPGLIPELSGIAAFQAVGVQGPAFVFAPYENGLNDILATYWGGPGPAPTVTGGEAGGGAMLALFRDPIDDLKISSSDIQSGTFSCSTATECVTQATNGVVFEVDGFTGDLVGGVRQPAANEYWTALSQTPDPSVILDTATGVTQGFFNAGLSVLDPGTSGATNAPTQIGLQGPVPVLVTGGLLGGGFSQWADTTQRDSLVASGYTATSNTVLNKDVPAPATLALIGAGLLGFYASRRRRAA